MWILGGAKLGEDSLGPALETVRVSPRTNQGSFTGTPFIRFDEDSHIITFPDSEDVRNIQRDKIQKIAESEAEGGARDQANFGSFDRVRIEIMDLDTDTFRDDLEAWRIRAKEGRDFAFGFNDMDRVFRSISKDVARGATRIELESTEGIEAGRKYILRTDILGMNATKNLAPNGGFNNDIVGANPNGQAVISRDTTIKSEGTASLKVVTQAVSTPGMFEDIVVPSRRGFFVASAVVRGVDPLRIMIRRIQDGVTIDSTTDFQGNGLFQPVSVMALIPPGTTITQFRVFILMQGATAGTFWVDEFQVEQREFPTAFADTGLPTFSVSTQDCEERVIIKRVIDGVGVILENPTRFSYKIRDVLKSVNYWERLVLLNQDPIIQKTLTVDVTAETRESPP